MPRRIFGLKRGSNRRIEVHNQELNTFCSMPNIIKAIKSNSTILVEHAVTGTCKCGNELSGSIQAGEFDYMGAPQHLKKASAAWS